MRRIEQLLAAPLLAATLLVAVCARDLAHGSGPGALSDVSVVELRSDGAADLLGTDNPRPRLEWRLDAARRGVLQRGYQVLVASAPRRLRPGKADMWDSGRIISPTLGAPARDRVSAAARIRAPGGASNGPVRSAEQWADYAGRPLASRTRYYWTVRIWDERGRASSFAAPAWFETALLRPEEWRAEWIAGPPRVRRDGVDALLAPGEVAASGDACRPAGPPGPLAFADEPRRDEYIARWPDACRAVRPAPLLRRAFVVDRAVTRARLYVSGLAYADVHLNGVRVGDGAVLEPGYTDYGKTVLYATYDVTGAIRPGTNALGVELGSGFYDYDLVSEWSWNRASWRGDPRLLLELHLELDDGRTQVVRSGAGWRTSAGPTRYDNINIGETHDARFAQPGWTEAGFDDAAWTPARPVPPPTGTLAAQTHEPIAILARRQPSAVAEPRPGIRVYDFGVQTTGWAEFEIEAEPGQAAEIRYGEGLLPDGTVDLTRNLHVADRLQTDLLVVGPSGRVRWRPRFSYKGFRYVQLSGPEESAFAGRVLDVAVDVVRSAVRTSAQFGSDNEILNGIFTIVARTIANNLHGIVTDTPVYEKNGWTGDAQLTAPTAATLFDMRRLYAKWLRDLRDAQTAGGEIPVIVPSGGAYGYTGVGWEAVWGATPAWDAALFVIPWEVYAHYGDERVLRATYAAMQRYVDVFMPAWAPGHIVESELGDWLTPTAQLTRLVPTAFYAEVVRRLSSYAELLGKPGDRDRYRKLHGEIRAAFEAAFFDPASGHYRQDAADAFAQTAQLVPLAFALVPEARRAQLIDALVDDVALRGGNLATGIVGTRYILKELTRAGRIDAAFGIATQTDRPSWGEWLELGYTSLLEAWGPAVRSQNHHMFGSIGQWLIEDLAGIEPRRPGYAEIEFRPEVPSAGLDTASAELATVRGRVASSWRKSADHFELDVEVPPGSIGVVHLPASDPARVAESGAGMVVQPAEQAPFVERLGIDGGRLVYRVGSGTYRFRVDVIPTS